MKVLFTFLTAGLLVCLAQPKSRAIDFTQQLKDLGGEPITISVDKANKPVYMTLGDAAVTAIESQLPEDKDMTGVAKFERDELARKIYKHNSATLTVEEIAMVKERIGKNYGPLIVGAAWRLLDPALAGK